MYNICCYYYYILIMILFQTVLLILSHGKKDFDHFQYIATCSSAVSYSKPKTQPAAVFGVDTKPSQHQLRGQTASFARGATPGGCNEVMQKCSKVSERVLINRIIIITIIIISIINNIIIIIIHTL